MLTIQIYAEDVNFFKYLHTKYLVTACDKKNFHKAYPFAYPPKFVLEVSSRNAQKDSDIELRFTGAQRELTTEIQLNLVRSELLVITIIMSCSKYYIILS